MTDGQTIVPLLRYVDARAAIGWLGAAFGFVELFSVPPSGPVVRHAQLGLRGNIVMLGSVRGDVGMERPRTAGTGTQAICVFLGEHGAAVDAHHARAEKAGARIVSAPQDTDFGAREYHVLDCEGHPWTFGTYRPPSGPG
jgi:uncharacterized glyoxalase superfamily protein PhnB